ncbi:MAG: hypothetical protein K2O42_06155 [Oscillospiraceae bacterium]|nr:hypothetical protein [Oscillospiraceae bacterium]
MLFFKNHKFHDSHDNAELSEMRLPQKKFPWRAVNMLIGTLLFLNGFLFLVTFGFSTKMFVVNVILHIFLVYFYYKWLETGKFRKKVLVLRTFAILVTIIPCIAPFVLMNFSYSRIMYPVKEYLYCSNFDGSYYKYLPKKLPAVCEDYKFVTQGGMIAQDYHASAYLMFHTDTETMQKLEEDYKRLDGAKCVEITPITKYAYLPKHPEEFPGHVYSRLDDVHIHDFFDAIIYRIPFYYDKGCILDYDSGLVVYWT